MWAKLLRLVKAFQKHFSQIILVGEAAFVKLLLETGQRAGIDWQSHVTHVILGEEPLAENARTYLEGILGIDPIRPGSGTTRVPGDNYRDTALPLFRTR